MLSFLKVFQIVISVLLMISILVQNRTSGLSSGSSTTFQSTKRGAEKVVYNATILFAILFVLSSLAFLFVS